METFLCTITKTISKSIKTRNFFFLLVFLIASFGAVAQSTTGKVLDANTAEPISSVNVYITTRDIGTITTADGSFEFTRKLRNNEVLQFSHIGYITQSIKIKDLAEINYKVRLVKHQEELTRVTLQAKKQQESLSFQTLPKIPEGLHSFSDVIYKDKLYLFGGDESEVTDQALKLLDTYMPQSLQEYIKLIMLYPDMDWRRFNSDLYIFDLKTISWQKDKIATLERAYHQAEIIDGKIYNFGGITLSKNRSIEYLPNRIEIYDPENRNIQIDETYPHQAINFTSFTYNDMLFVAGGSIKKIRKTNRKIYTNKFHVYNPESGFWKELNPMPEAKETTGILQGDQYYFIGGYNNKVLSHIEKIDLRTGKWDRLGELFEPAERPSLSTMDSIIYIYTYNKLVCFNTDTNTLKEYKIDIDTHSPGMKIYKDALYIYGGYTQDQFELLPSSKFYRVPLHQFRLTKIQREKHLKDIQEQVIN